MFNPLYNNVIKEKCIVNFHCVVVILPSTSGNWATYIAFPAFVLYVDLCVIFRPSRHDKLCKHVSVYLQQSTGNTTPPLQVFQVWNRIKTMSHKRLRYAGPPCKRKTQFFVLTVTMAPVALCAYVLSTHTLCASVLSNDWRVLNVPCR